MTPKLDFATFFAAPCLIKPYSHIKRGYWELAEPLTTDEEWELHYLKDFDKWEEVTTDDKKEWKLKDPDDQQRYDELYKKDQAYNGSVHLPKPEYILESTTNVGIG